MNYAAPLDLLATALNRNPIAHRLELRFHLRHSPLHSPLHSQLHSQLRDLR